MGSDSEKVDLGAKAALSGFRRQALYALSLLIEEADSDTVVQPEGKEDIALFKDGELVRVIQVKAYSSPLQLSDLKPQKSSSFLHRTRRHLGTQTAVELGSFAATNRREYRSCTAELLWLELIELFRAGIFTFAQALGGNVGGGIVCFSLLVRLALLPLTYQLARRSLAHRSALRKLQPELERLRKRFRRQPEKLAAASRKLFEQHGTQPVDSGSLLGALAQMPVFLAWGASTLVSIAQAAMLRRQRASSS